MEQERQRFLDLAKIRWAVLIRSLHPGQMRANPAALTPPGAPGRAPGRPGARAPGRRGRAPGRSRGVAGGGAGGEGSGRGGSMFFFANTERTTPVTTRLLYSAGQAAAGRASRGNHRQSLPQHGHIMVQPRRS